ncbi:hypothetical protein E2C01_013322 [Portunus trituberculatus]|uniref:Uncharacterized protein n=1 Tax=Portunus trituberculatus TaxID=210409 RepID=A0A5B7DGC3_PORTR|nr:hypothetical protein [Portunus trituberculatus]
MHHASISIGRHISHCSFRGDEAALPPSHYLPDADPDTSAALRFQTEYLWLLSPSYPADQPASRPAKQPVSQSLQSPFLSWD